ncbi:MAG: phosphomannomutase/phosphoglucomutase [Patescibacteria group bacterium]|jgi:phosphomannomutase
MSASVFHAYDIRGLAPGELDAAFSARLARAVIREFSPKKVLVGRDMRLTSPDLEDALVSEFTKHGVDVVRIGLCSTPVFNVIVGLEDGAVDLGVMVTASHNPGKYNGFKMVKGDMTPIGQGSGMEQIEKSFEADSALPESSSQGSVTEDTNAVSRYVDHILKLAALPSDMPAMKIGIDVGNGMAGAVLPELLKRLPWLDAKVLYMEPDGNFPNHEANPLKRDTLKDLSNLVTSEQRLLGVAFDGDADRVGFVDEAGVPIPGDFMTAVLATEILAEHPGSLVLYDLRSSWSVPEAIEAAGGTAKMCRVGHAFIKRQMREEGAVFAGEVSMHYYFRDIKNVESGDLVMLLILKRLAHEGKPFSSLWKPLLRYVHSGEINFEVTDKAAAVERIKAAYGSKATSVSEIDGIRMEFGDWWFSLRLSNTEPLIRLNLESKTEEMTKQKVEELSALIKT